MSFIIRVWSKSYSDWWSYVGSTLSKFVAKKPFQIWYQNEKQGAFPYRWTNALPFASLTQPEKKAMDLDLDWGWGCDWTSTNERASKSRVTSHESRVTSHESRHVTESSSVSYRTTNQRTESNRARPYLDLIQTRRVRDERWEGIHFISFHFIQREKGSTNSISRIEREGHSEDDQPAL